MNNDTMGKMRMAMLGQGMARKAGEQMQQVPDYKQYVVEAQMAGIPIRPKTDPNWIQEYMQMMGMGQPQQPQGLLSQ